MLDSIRKRKDNFIYSFLILAVVAVMAFYGVGKMSGNQDGGGGAVAWVNGDIITRIEFQQELEYRMNQYQSMLGGQYDEKLLAALQIPQRTLQDMIQSKLLAQQAKGLDIQIPDKELADQIRSIPYYQKDGKFDAELYSKIPNRGVEERRQRERMRLVRFQTYLADRVKLTPDAVRRAYLLRETKADLEYAKIDFNKLASGVKATAKDIDAFLAKTDDKKLQETYDANQKDFTEKAGVQLKQIRVGIPFQASAAQKAEAKKKIEAIAKEVNADNFSEVAKKQSDDEFAKKGGSVGWINRGSLEPPLEATIDHLDKGKVSGPVETSFGFFIVQVLDKREEVTRPLKDVKRQVAERAVTDELKKKFIEEKKTAWEKQLAEGKSIAPELQKLKIEVKKTGAFSLGGGFIPGIGQADSLLDEVFLLTKEAPVAKKLLSHQDFSYFIKLNSIEYPKETDLAKNEEVVEKGLTTPLQSELLTRWVAALEKTANIKNELKTASEHGGAGHEDAPIAD